MSNSNTPPEAVRAAIGTLAQFCIDNGYDAFKWTLRNGPHDPDGGVSDWVATIGPAKVAST